MSSNGDVVREWMERAWNQRAIGTLEDCAQYFGEDYVGRDAAGRVEEERGLDSVLDYVKWLHGALGEMKVTVHDVLESGDRVTCRLSFSAVHVGECFGIEPREARVNEIGAIFIARFRDGRIREAWQTWDRLRFIRQLADGEQELDVESRGFAGAGPQ